MIVGEARLEAGQRIYAIGDIHGCFDQLQHLLQLIDADLQNSPVSKYKLIFLGDYVDRGPANRAVIDVLIALQKSERDCVFLLGNHDERISVFLENPDFVWDDVLRWGGARTLENYGIVLRPGESHQELSGRFSKVFPEEHREFLQSLKRSYSVGDYFFCHAGVRPETSLENQSDYDLIWIRQDFLLHEKPFEKVVVHGHTPVDNPEVKLNRINVDTRCYSSGILTTVVLEGNSQRFLQTI